MNQLPSYELDAFGLIWSNNNALKWKHSAWIGRTRPAMVELGLKWVRSAGIAVTRPEVNTHGLNWMLNWLASVCTGRSQPELVAVCLGCSRSV